MLCKCENCGGIVKQGKAMREHAVFCHRDAIAINDFREMCDNAAACCQRKELLENESVRECIKLNVYDPMLRKIIQLQDQLTGG